MKFLYYIVVIFFGLFLSKIYAYSVSSSILPLQSLTSMVTENISNAKLIINPSISPHDLELTYTQSSLIHKSDLIIIISKDFEHVIYDSVTDKSRIIEMVNAPHIKIRKHTGYSILKSQHLNKKHSAEITDFHIWLDTNNAIAFLKYLAKELASRDPKNANIYLANATRYIQIIKNIPKLKNNTHLNNFITYHNGYSYLINELDLTKQNKGYIAKDSHHGSSISIKSLLNLNQFVNDNTVSCILMEKNLPDKTIQKFIVKNKIHSQVLDAIGNTKNQGRIQEAYINLIKHNTKMIQDCIS